MANYVRVIIWGLLFYPRSRRGARRWLIVDAVLLLVLTCNAVWGSGAAWRLFMAVVAVLYACTTMRTHLMEYRRLTGHRDN